MSDSSNTNKFYVSTPSSANYELANNSVLEKASKFGTISHRLLSAIGDRANIEDEGSTSYKYLEDHLFSTKNVKIHKSSTKSILNKDYVKDMYNEVGSVYKVLRFNRSHNIRAFDFIITYSQVSAFGSEVYKPIIQTKQFKGSLLFTGCSIVRDVETMEELPLKLYGKYESIGDTPNSRLDLDAADDARGGPSITLKYTFDDNYVYLYISSISPFRLIPIGDGEYRDISYIEGKGLLTGETKENLIVTDDAFNNSKKIVDFSNDNRIWCDISMSLKDVTISHDSDNAEFVDYDKDVLTKTSTVLREQSVSLIPTNDGEQIVIGIEPASTVNLDLTPDTTPVRFGGSLLNSSKDEMINYINKLKERIISCSKYTEKVAFTVKTSIRTKGKYNINGDYFIDNNADSFGQILITDIGTYNSITNEFDITEYIFDKNQTKYTKLNTVKNYKDYSSNASNYLSSISDGTNYSSVRKTSELLDVLSNVNFDTPDNLEVYFNVAFLKSNNDFDVLYSFAEFGEDNSNNDDDYIVYICKDNKIRIVNFKDYNMENIVTYDLIKNIEVLKNSNSINKCIRSYIDDKYVYFIGTDNGYTIRIDDITDVKNIKFSYFGTFDKLGLDKESISLMDSDDNYTYIGGAKGSISIYNNKTENISYIDSIFTEEDPVLLVKSISDDYLVFITKEELASYCISSNKWNYIGDTYRIGANFKNPFNELPNPNIDYIIEKEGFKGVPIIQIDNFIYALGLRKDQEAGYVPVYKKLNILTGETCTISVPKLQLYKPELCHDTRYIYSLGGSNVNDNSADKNLTYVEIYDIINDEWVELKSNSLTIPDNVVFESSSIIHPTVYNKSVYVIHPKASIVTKNADTGGYTYQEKIINSSYKFTFNETEKSVDVSTLDNSFENNLPSDISIVPFIFDKNKVHYFSASPDLSNSTYNNYKLKKYLINFDDLSVTTSEITFGTEEEFASQYASGNFTDAPNDLFKDISIYSEGNECIIFLLSRFILYIYSNDAITVTEMHAVYHNIGKSAAHLPLITTGTYESWKKYNKNVSNNLYMIRIKNYVVFIGGDTGRVPEYLSLDSMSLIPAPSFYERELKNSNSSVLSNTDSLINVVPDDSFEYDELATCRSGNTVYMIAFIKSELKAYLMEYKLNDPLRKPRIIKDITSTITVNRKILHYVDMQYLEEVNVLLIASVNSISLTDKTVNDTLFNVIAYNIENGNVSSIITESDKFANSKMIYPIISSKNIIEYVSDKNIGYKISILSGIVSFEDINSGYSLTDLSETVNSLSFAKGINSYSKSFFIVNKINSTDIECIDIDSKKNVISYSIPNSKNYTNGDIFKSGNYIYATKGANGSIIGNDIFKFDISTLVTENGGENSVKHALLDSSSSRFLAPMAISKSKELVIFGLARPEKSVLKVFYSNITDDTFIPYITEIDISHNKKINYNRFNPKFTSFDVNGSEFLLVFGGTQSLQTKTTKVVDVYNTKKHVWTDSISLPTELSHISICENSIIGATQEDIEKATSKAYARKIDFVYDETTSTFSTKTTDYPSINGLVYPKYAKYCLNEDKTKLYIVPTLIDNTIDIDNKNIYCVDLTNKSYITAASLPELVYFETREILGVFAGINNLVLISYNKKSNTLSVLKYSYSSNTWNETKKTILPFVPETNKEYSSSIESNLSVFEDLVNIVKNDNGLSNRTKAVLSLLNTEDNHVYNMYFSYNTSDGLFISSLISDSNFSHGLLSDVDEMFVNNKGFTYLADRTNAKIYRLFPNNDSNAFGVKSINYIDTENALSRIAEGNVIFSAKVSDTTLTISASDISTGISTDYSFDISSNKIDETKPVILKISEKALYIVYSSTDKNCIVKLIEIGNKLKAVSDISIKTLSEISTDFSICDNIEDENKIYFKSDNEVKVYNIIENSTNTYTLYKPEGFINVLKENNNTLYYLVYSNREFAIMYDEKYNSRISSSLSGLTLISKNVRVINNTVYLINTNGYVYEMILNQNMNVSKMSCLYSTELTEFSNNIIIRNCDILDISKEIKYTNPNYINSSTFCFDDSDISYYNELILSIQENSDNSHDISLYDFDSHKLINRITLSEDFDISSNDNCFVAKTDGIYKLCVLKTNKIIVINCLDSSVSEIENDAIDSSYEPIHIQYLNKFIVGNDNNSFILYNPIDNSISKQEVYFKNQDYSLKQIIYVDIAFKKYYALMYKPEESIYYLGKFDSSHNELIFSNKTSLTKSENDVIKSSTDKNVFFLVNSDSAIKFKLDDLNNNILTLENYSNYINISKRDSKSLITLNTIKNNNSIANNFIHNNKLEFNNEYISKSLDETYTPIIRNIDDFHIIICKELTETNYSIFFINTKINKYIKISTDIDFSSNFTIDINNRYFDSALDGGIVKLYHIVDIVNDEIRDLSIKVEDPTNAVKSVFDTTSDNKISLIYNDELDESHESVNICCRVFNVQNSYIAVLNNCKLTLKTLSSSWKIISTTNIFENSKVFDSDFKIVISSDLIFVINPTNKTSCVIENPHNGTLYNVDSFDNNCKSIELPDTVYNTISLINDDVIVCNNERYAKCNKFGVLFDTIIQCSEFYNKYIGVSHFGEPNSIVVPISEYEIGDANVTSETNQMTYRSKENVKVYLNMLYKSAATNIVASTSVISKLNTSNFVLSHVETVTDKVGNIYAFLNSSVNGELVRNDVSYYDDNYGVAIINNKTIKIKINDQTFTYNSVDNEIPLSNEILPIVITYGEFTNSSNNIEERYYSFIDIKGNIITYDKELETFIDVSGSVDVEIPYYSTEAFIYQSKTNLLDDTNKIVKNIKATSFN